MPLPPSICSNRPGGGATFATLQARATLMQVLRHFFASQDFLEVETPILSRYAGLEPHLDPFESRYRPTPQQEGIPVYLLTSPEYALKRLLVAGAERVYQVAKVFRNGETGPFHNPEFTMLEWYRTPGSYLDIMVDTEGLVCVLAESLGKGEALCWQGHRVSLERPWRRLSVREAFLEYAGLALEDMGSAEVFRRAAQGLGMHVPVDADWDEIYFRVLVERVEPRLGFDAPTFLYDYPAQFAALSQVRVERPFPVAERFELYVAGVEVANAYSELTDPVVQAQRFEEERAFRARLALPVLSPDPDYLAALRSGLPPTGGIAVGVDRLMMLLLDVPDVRATLAFPFYPPGWEE